MDNITTYAQLGGTVVTVILFLRYLTKRDSHWNDSSKNIASSNIVLAKALQRLTDIVERNSSANISNTSRLEDNALAVEKNVDAVKENTEVIKTKNGNHSKGII